MRTQHNRPARTEKRHKQPGSSPGSLVYTGEKQQDTVSLQLIQFTENAIHCQHGNGHTLRCSAKLMQRR